MPYIEPFNGSEITAASSPTVSATSFRISYFVPVSCSVG